MSRAGAAAHGANSEVTFSDGRPGPGEALRTDRGVVTPEQIDAFTAFIAGTLLPDLEKRQGYRSLTVLVERDSGDVRVTSSWSDPRARRAAADAFLQVLRNAAEFGLRPIEIVEP